jgi:hypothetical protein
MAFNHLMLPQYQVANGFDVSPISNALDSNRENALAQNRLGLQRRQVDLAERADTRAGETHGLQMAQMRRQSEQEEARMVAGRIQYIQGLPPEQRMAAWKTARLQPGFRDLPAEFDNFEYAAPQLLGKAAEYVSEADKAKLGLTKAQTAQAYAQADRARRENTETGLVPQYMVGEDGVTRPFVVNKKGQGVPVQLPQGMRALGPGGVAEARAAGTGAGRAQVDLPKVQQGAATTLKYIDDVLNDPNLPSVTGAEAYLPTVRSTSHDTEARIAQLGGRAFLSAFESLKGGGAITEVEGKKATDALARLANMKQSDAGYKKALEDFRHEVKDLVRIAEQRARGVGPRGSGSFAPPAGGGWSIQRVD